MSLQISKADAAKKAMQLAQNFMREQDTRGWEWDLDAARPDPVDPDVRGRKIARRWIVSVQYKKEYSFLNGPGIIVVDIADNTAAFIESP